jgi:hypothetical protein
MCCVSPAVEHKLAIDIIKEISLICFFGAFPFIIEMKNS